MNPLLGIGLKLVSTLTFSMMGASIKLVADRYPTGEIMFARSFFALIPLLIWLAWRGELRDAAKTNNPWGHLRRSLVGAISMFLSFMALARLPLPDATAIGYTAPLLAVVLAAVVLKEVVRVYRWSAVAVGFCGVILMLSPHLSPQTFRANGLDTHAVGSLLGLLAAFFVSVAVIEVRRLARVEKTATIVFYFSMLCAAAGLVTIFWGWRWPTPMDAAILVGVGILGGIGQILLTASYRFADTATIAPFEYTSMIWAMALGYMMFGDLPQPVVLAGAGIVIAAGLFVIWRERKLGLARPSEEKTAKPRVV